MSMFWPEHCKIFIPNRFKIFHYAEILEANFKFKGFGFVVARPLSLSEDLILQQVIAQAVHQGLPTLPLDDYNNLASLGILNVQLSTAEIVEARSRNLNSIGRLDRVRDYIELFNYNYNDGNLQYRDVIVIKSAVMIYIAELSKHMRSTSYQHVEAIVESYLNQFFESCLRKLAIRHLPTVKIKQCSLLGTKSLNIKYRTSEVSFIEIDLEFGNMEMAAHLLETLRL